MQTYSPFFQTLYDQEAAVGTLGRGTHYSVLRATVFHDEQGKVISPNIYHNAISKFHDFAIIWDEDHDTRIVDIIEKIYQEGLLACFSFFGERKASFTALYTFENSLTSENEQCIDITVKNICEETIDKKYNDVWNSQLGTISSSKGIINADDNDVKLYLQNIQMLWKLGSKEIV